MFFQNDHWQAAITHLRLPDNWKIIAWDAIQFVGITDFKTTVFCVNQVTTAVCGPKDSHSTLVHSLLQHIFLKNLSDEIK